MEISLSGLSWEVKGFWPYVPIKEKSMETGQTLAGVTDWLPAAVPGGIHADLFRAGLIEDPYFGKNSLPCEWVENRWWMYRTKFPAVTDGHDLREGCTLCFCGLDYEAEVFVNDVSCGSHKGMYNPFEVDVTKLLQEENKLVVVFKGVPDEMGQIGYTSRTSTQKSRFNYKWDFSTRLVNMGFWKDVVLRIKEEISVADFHLDTDYEKGAGQVYLSGKVVSGNVIMGSNENEGVNDGRKQAEDALTITVTLTGPFDRRNKDVKALAGTPEKEEELPKPCRIEASIPVSDGMFSAVITVPDPFLWQPNGRGIPWLYQVDVKLEDSGKVLWNKQYQTGIRSLSLTANEGAPSDALSYTFVLNGRKTYIKGVNMTPLDHVYGCVSGKRYELMVTAMVHAHVNLVRIWGGGLIEKEEFYDLCDENGILIWQEFIQSSSGIDNKPCEDPGFLSLLEKAAASAVAEKRNHVSLAVYSGGNELMEEPDRPSGYDNPNLSMLKEIVEKEDGRRAFLPTSASGPREFVTKEKNVSHDVHGNWRYEGNPGHYELYGESDNLFHSEFGMDGVSESKSLRRFLPEEDLYPTPMSGNARWQHHGEWWGTYFRDCEMFGSIPMEKEHLETFIRCSQYMQAEGLRFILEADRRRAFRNSGTIIWQLNEPWPNSSCTNLVDYYGETKAAYYQTRRAYEHRHVSMDYRSLSFSAGETCQFPLYVFNDGEAFQGRVTVQLKDLSGTILDDRDFEVLAESNRSTKAGSYMVTVPEEQVFFICLMLWEKDRLISENRYLFATRKETPFEVFLKEKGKVEICQGKAEELPYGRKRIPVKLTNTGSRTVLGARVIAGKEGQLIWGSDNDLILFPGEEKELSVYMVPSPDMPFEEPKEWDGTEEVKLIVEYL
mgnify:CR=1 FL=1